MKKLTILLIISLCAAAFTGCAVTSKTKALLSRQIAVYVAGDVSEDGKKEFSRRLAASFIYSGCYMPIKNYDLFLAEMVKPRGGPVEDSQIAAFGERFGAGYVVIADITPVSGAFHVSARLANVSTGEVVFLGEFSGALRNAADFSQICDQIVKNSLANSGLKPRPRVGIGAGGFYSNNIGGGVKWPNGEQIAMPYSGGGAYLFSDLGYLEASMGYFAGGGKWKSADASTSGYLPDMRLTDFNVGMYFQYPFGVERVTFFPLLGIDADFLFSPAKIESKGRIVSPPKNDVLMWFKLGGGADINLWRIDMWRSVHLRTELLYGWRTASMYEEFLLTNYDVKPRPGSGLTIKTGIGLKY